MKQLLLYLIRAYQIVISPCQSNCCRFYPSCSNYGHQAIQQYGPAKGSILAVHRILKCHPFGSSGFDPVPHNNTHHSEN